MSFKDVEAALRASLEPQLAERGEDLEDLRVQLAGKRRLVRILVDSDVGVTLDRVAEISKMASEELDRTNLLGEAAYVLEVSSPGVERPITLPRHWRRNLRRQVRVQFKDDREPIAGRVTDIGDSKVSLLVDGEVEEILLSDINKAVVQVDFKKDQGPSAQADRENVDGH